MIVSGDAHHRTGIEEVDRDAFVVGTPLDMITNLERQGDQIVLVVLTGAFARNSELARFLAEVYPALQIIDDLDGAVAAYA